MDEIKHMNEADKIMEIPISYEEKGKAEGKKVALRMPEEDEIWVIK